MYRFSLIQFVISGNKRFDLTDNITKSLEGKSEKKIK